MSELSKELPTQVAEGSRPGAVIAVDDDVDNGRVPTAPGRSAHTARSCRTARRRTRSRDRSRAWGPRGLAL
jgi:hypothetical protein